MAEAYNNRQG